MLVISDAGIKAAVNINNSDVKIIRALKTKKSVISAFLPHSGSTNNKTIYTTALMPKINKNCTASSLNTTRLPNAKSAVE